MEKRNSKDTKKMKQKKLNFVYAQKDYDRLVERYIKGLDDHLYKCISVYKNVENPRDWKPCPNCGLIPKVWEFDNGRFTACGCGENEYKHFSIQAESINSVMKHSHNGASIVDYDRDALRKNWNHWVETGEILFNPKDNDRW